MKPLENLSNVEKAKLLHELFPKEIPELLKFTNSLCATLLEDKEAPSKWNNSISTYEMWQSCIKKVGDKISHYDKRLNNRSQLFADQLFDGYSACFTVHSLRLYVTARQHPNTQFVDAVKMLFEIQ